LPLSALPLIFPYGSYIETFGKGIGDNIDLGGCPEVSGFRLRPRLRGRDLVLTPKGAGGKKSARGSVALLLDDLARREHL